MEIQTKASKLKNNLLFPTNQLNIKGLKKDLKSKSENKHKKFYKNYNLNNEKEFQNKKNNLKKFETLEEFKQKLKIDELNNKLNNLLIKKHEESSQTSVLHLSGLNNNKNGKNEKEFFGSFYNKRDIKTPNMNSKNRHPNNINYKDSSIINNLNVTSRTNVFNLHSSNVANTSLKSDFPEYIARNIRTANIQLGANTRKVRFQSVDFNVSNILNANSTIKDFDYNSNSNNNNKNSDANNKLNLINIPNFNNDTNKESKYEKQVEKTGISFDDYKTNFNENTKINNNYNNNVNNHNKILDAAKLEKQMNELIKCYFNCKDEDLEDENINSFYYKELLNKLQIKNFSNSKEEKLVLEFLKNQKNILDSSELYNSTFKKFSAIEKVYVSESSFKNPVSALRKLKLNKDIFNNVTEFRQQKQINTYLDVFNEEQHRVLKQMQMGRIKETDMKAFDCNEDKGEVIIPIDLLHEKNDVSSYNFNNKQLSRGQVLNYNLEFFASNNTEFKMKPWARSSFTLNVDESKIIMFGGISGEILYQVWVCDCRSNLFCL